MMGLRSSGISVSSPGAADQNSDEAPGRFVGVAQDRQRGDMKAQSSASSRMH